MKENFVGVLWIIVKGPGFGMSDPRQHAASQQAWRSYRYLPETDRQQLGIVLVSLCVGEKIFSGIVQRLVRENCTKQRPSVVWMPLMKQKEEKKAPKRSPRRIVMRPTRQGH